MLVKVFCAFLIITALLAAVSFKQGAVGPNSYYNSCPFSFTLKQDAKTSAGVFNAEGVLVKTLWSGVRYPAGTHSAVWNGTDNDGNLAPPARYQIKVLSNNVKYTWEGVIGNTSEQLTGPTVFRAHNAIQGIAIAGNTAYYTVGYNEQGGSGFKFNTQKPFSKATIAGGGIEAYSVTTDGKNVYWAAYEIKTNTNFIHATSVANDAAVNLSGGQLMQVVKTKAQLNVLERASLPDKIKGLAVQKNGQCLLVAHYSTNEVHVLNKTTGLLLSKLTLTNPDAIAVDGSNHAWVSYMNNGKPVVSLFEVTASGNLKSLNKSLPGLMKPLAITVSPDDATVLVADGGNSQQLKAYNNKLGTLKWTYGEAGGYSHNVNVRNDKFYFSDMRRELGTCIAFEPDGSFWVEDSGNNRLQHYSANRIFINRIMYLPTSYCVAVDRNCTDRVFFDFMEFKIDYKKPLQPNNGSWTLIKNWGARIPADLDHNYYRLKDITTLSNGRTYAFVGSKLKRNWQVIELTKQDTVRFTGIELPLNYSLYADGSLNRISNFNLGAPNAWIKRAFTSFNTSNNPVWANETTVAQTQPGTTSDPLFDGSGIIYNSGEMTTSGVLVGFNPKAPPKTTYKPHLGGIKLGGNKWLWQTAISTSRNYRGDFPADGTFDNGNNVRYAGSIALASDRSVFWGYHGEFWKNSQTNKWNQVYDDGLFVGQFGVTGTGLNSTEAPAMLAGNVLSAAIVKDAGNTYMYHNDESQHSGVHRWKISNLESISEQTIPVSLIYTKQGLLAEYFTGEDLNNMNRIFSGISATVNKVQVGNQPVSARFTGFIKPISTASYVFQGTVATGMRLWLNNKLIINNWNNKNGAEKSSPVLLDKNTPYAIKIEYRQLNSNSNDLLQWSLAGGPAEEIPAAQLWPANSVEQTPVDLLAGLPYDSALQDGLYGWRRDKAAEDLTNQYSKWWTVHTSVRKYDQFSSPDLFIHFRQANTVNTVTRNLGNSNAPLKQWKLNAMLNFGGNYANEDKDLSANGIGGSYIEVLDDAGKVITRLFFHSDNSTDVGQLFANNKSVFKTTRVGLRSSMYTTQPLIVSMENGIATITFGPYNAVKTSAFDPASHWNHPQTLRFYFWCKTQNSSRLIDIEKLDYSFRK